MSINHHYTDLLVLASAEVAEYYHNHSSYHHGDAGIDIFCPQDVVIAAESYSNQVKLGIKCAMLDIEAGSVTDATNKQVSMEQPLSYRLALRSSTALRTPLRLANNEGIIDAGYRGEICAIFDNPSKHSYQIKKGSRLVQIVGPSLQPLGLKVVNELPTSQRNEAGLGSTGQ